MTTDRSAATVPRTVPQLLRATAGERSSVTAVVCGRRRITYRDLESDAARLARLLTDRGVGPGTMVAVVIARSYEAILAWWAITETGATVVPVGPAVPDRMSYVIDESAARVGLTTAGHRAGLPDSVDWIVLDDAPESRSESDSDSPRTVPGPPHAVRARSVQADDVGHLLYFSTLTGRPRGALLTHRTLTTLAHTYPSRFGADESSRVLHLAAPHDRRWLFESLLTLGAGATAVVAPASVTAGDELAELIRRESVTHTFLTADEAASIGPADLPSLRCVVVDGADLPDTLVPAWATARNLFLAYGASAVPVTTCAGPIATGVAVLGAPLPGMSAHLLDSRLEPVPFGEVGDLYLAGPALAVGFHRCEALTADRLVADPFAADGSRMLRTPDRMRWVRAESGPALEYVEGPFPVMLRPRPGSRGR